MALSKVSGAVVQACAVRDAWLPDFFRKHNASIRGSTREVIIRLQSGQSFSLEKKASGKTTIQATSWPKTGVGGAYKDNLTCFANQVVDYLRKHPKSKEKSQQQTFKPHATRSPYR